MGDTCRPATTHCTGSHTPPAMGNGTVSTERSAAPDTSSAMSSVALHTSAAVDNNDNDNNANKTNDDANNAVLHTSSAAGDCADNNCTDHSVF
jgi:hypothetical protein